VGSALMTPKSRWTAETFTERIPETSFKSNALEYKLGASDLEQQLLWKDFTGITKSKVRHA
jgi:hypothetical protein